MEGEGRERKACRFKSTAQIEGRRHKRNPLPCKRIKLVLPDQQEKGKTKKRKLSHARISLVESTLG